MAGVRLEFAQFGHFEYFNIYRNSVSTAIENLGEPIGISLTMYYEDLTVEPNQDYYYRAGVIRDSVENFSEEFHVKTLIEFDPPYDLMVEFKNDETNRLELNWKLDGFVDEQRYYCSETPIDPENLPVPKAVLAGDVRTYVDTSIDVGKTYYVRVGSVKDGLEKLSAEQVCVTERLLVFMPLTSGINDFGSLGLSWSKLGSITHSSEGAYFNDDVPSWIKQTVHNFGSKYKFSIEFKRLIGVSAYLPLVYFTGNVLPRDLGYSSGTPSGESYLVNKVYVDFSYISATAAAQNISNNIWHKLTVERDNRNIKIYIDGVLSLNFNLSESPNSSSVTMLGHAPATTPNKFKGWLRNFKVYDLT